MLTIRQFLCLNLALLMMGVAISYVIILYFHLVGLVQSPWHFQAFLIAPAVALIALAVGILWQEMGEAR